MIDHERLAAYKAIISAPTDPTIARRLTHRTTAPRVLSTQTRIARYLRHATAYLMHRDLERDGDLD